MKTILLFSILFSAIAWLPVRAELTETDLENIRQIFREEWEKPITDSIDPIDTSLGEIEATVVEINTHLDSINGSLNRIQMMLWIAIVVVGVAGSVNWTSILTSKEQH